MHNAWMANQSSRFLPSSLRSDKSHYSYDTNDHKLGRPDRYTVPEDIEHQGDSCNCSLVSGVSHRVGEEGLLAFALAECWAGLCSVPRLTAFIFVVPSACCSEMPRSLKCGDSICHLRAFPRLLTAEVRPVIAQMENSFFSLAFIYTLILRKPFTHGGMVARGIGQRVSRGAQETDTGCALDKGEGSLGTRSAVGTAQLLFSGKSQWFVAAVRSRSWWLFFPSTTPTPCLATLFVNVQKTLCCTLDNPSSLHLKFRYPECGGYTPSLKGELRASFPSAAQGIWGLFLVHIHVCQPPTTSPAPIKRWSCPHSCSWS